MRGATPAPCRCATRMPRPTLTGASTPRDLGSAGHSTTVPVTRDRPKAGASRLASGRPTLTGERILSMLPLVVFSHLRWDFVYQRPQHLLSRFAASRPVLFIEEP